MKKFLTAAACLLLVFFICAWGEKKVELLDDRKLIDLGKAIELAKPGGESDEKTKDDGSDTSAEQASAGSDGKVIIISIRDGVITYNGRDFYETESLERTIRKDGAESMKISLKDDWAEAHIYRRVIRMLEKLHSETGLEFSYE